MGEWQRDAGFFEPLKLLDHPIHIERVPLKEAEGIVCCGPFDPMADPDVNRPEFPVRQADGHEASLCEP